MENKYYEYFRDALGRGEGRYHTNFGEIYRMRPGLQRGYGKFVIGRGMHRHRYGMGFGSVIMSLFKRAVPLLKVLGSKAVEVASNVAKDAIHGNNVKDSAIRHLSNEANTLMGSVPDVVTGFLNKNSSIRPMPVSTLVASPDAASTAITAKTVRKKKKLALQKKKRQIGRGQKFSALAYL